MARILDVIEHADSSGQEIVRRVPERGAGDFRIGSQLIVREGQAAVFFRDGKALDTFMPGRYTITTANIPLLANLVSAVFSGTRRSPPRSILSARAISSTCAGAPRAYHPAR